MREAGLVWRRDDEDMLWIEQIAKSYVGIDLDVREDYQNRLLNTQNHHCLGQAYDFKKAVHEPVELTKAHDNPRHVE